MLSNAEGAKLIRVVPHFCVLAWFGGDRIFGYSLEDGQIVTDWRLSQVTENMASRSIEWHIRVNDFPLPHFSDDEDGSLP